MSIDNIDFEIDNEKVLDLASFFICLSEEINNLYSDLLQLCDRVEENYISEDSSIFLDKFRNCINRFAYENEALYDGGKTLDKTNALYSQKEDKWVKEVTKLEEDKEVDRV